MLLSEALSKEKHQVPCCDIQKMNGQSEKYYVIIHNS